VSRRGLQVVSAGSLVAAVALTWSVLRGGAGGGATTALPDPPRSPTVTFDFQGGPSLVFLCWGPPGNAPVNFYDVQVTAWNGGDPRAEVRYGVSASDCSGALGVGEYMWKADMYHFAVRACNNAGCSGWADASSLDRYWFRVPCADASGDACARPLDLGAGGQP